MLTEKLIVIKELIQIILLRNRKCCNIIIMIGNLFNRYELDIISLCNCIIVY